MSHWFRRVQIWRRPKRRVSGWSGIGQSDIHSSLIVTLAVISAALLLISFARPGLAEFRSAALTLPVVWLLSLIVRIAAQQLAIGDFSHESDTTVCPTGNLQTEYEYLPARAILAYSMAGQLASVGLMSVGLVVNAAMTPTSDGQITIAQLLGFSGGWNSQAWATQIFWVNVFLFGLHLLPTVPFDMRALVFSCYSWKSRTAQEPQVFRRIASLNSHLSSLVLGIGLSLIGLGFVIGQEALGWYAVIGAIYLFVASQWEHSRADDLDEQFMHNKRVQQSNSLNPSQLLRPHLEFEIRSDDEQLDAVDLLGNADRPLSDADAKGSLAFESMDDGFDFSEEVAEEPYGSSGEAKLEEELPDIDEILRKVHKDGYLSLSEIEREALLIASREMKEKRNSL